MDTYHNPAHYTKGRRYEPIDVIFDWRLDFDLGNVVKYISRAGRKISDPGKSDFQNEIDDLNKAKVYLEHALAMRIAKNYERDLEDEYRKSCEENKDLDSLENTINAIGDIFDDALKAANGGD